MTKRLRAKLSKAKYEFSHAPSKYIGYKIVQALKLVTTINNTLAFRDISLNSKTPLCRFRETWPLLERWK